MALCHFCGCQVWLSRSDLRNRREDESQSFPMYLISMMIRWGLHPFLRLWKTVRDWIRAVLENSLVPTLPLRPGASRLRCTSEAIKWSALSCAYLNGTRVIVEQSLPASSPLGIDCHLRERTVSSHPKLPLEEALWEHLRPLSSHRSRETHTQWLTTAGRGLGCACHFHQDFILNHRPTGGLSRGKSFEATKW